VGHSREIPYAATPRPDTGFSNAQLGMGLFLTADMMLFAGLLSSYVLLRVNSILWPPDPHHPALIFGVVKTGMLLLVSAGMNAAKWRLRSGKGVRDLWLVSIAALVFLALTGMEYKVALNLGIVPAVNTFIGMFYALTAVHALHVFVGFLATIIVASTGAPLGKPDPVRMMSRRGVTALYWHFLTVVWIAIFWVLYLA
jgi:cytochrome c oxidase subunit 3